MREAKESVYLRDLKEGYNCVGRIGLQKFGWIRSYMNLAVSLLHSFFATAPELASACKSPGG